MKKNKSRGPRHGPSLRQTMYHKARNMLRKARLPKNGQCQTILERWYMDTKISRICLNMDGQKNKSDNTTHLLWKTFPMELHLQKGDDGEKNWHIVLNEEGKQGPMR